MESFETALPTVLLTPQSSPSPMDDPVAVPILFPSMDPAYDTDLDQNNSTIVINPDFNPRLPNGIIVAVLMLLGISGNTLVLYVYHFKMDHTVFSTFVTVLAILDLATAFVGMPIDLAIKSAMLERSRGLDILCKVREMKMKCFISFDIFLCNCVIEWSKMKVTSGGLYHPDR